MDDTGDPNVFTTYKGRFEVALEDGTSATSTVVMLTVVNDVQFCGDYTSGTTGILGQLPDECKPEETVYVPCFETTNHTLTYVFVHSDGTIMGEPDTVYELNGVSFHIAGNFYR